MKRKGQITFYIIIGVLLVIMFGLFLVMQNREETVGVQPEIFESVGSYVDLCFEQAIEEQTLLLGYSGGYLEPENYIKSDFGVITLYDEGISDDKFVSDLKTAVLKDFDKCINSFESLTGQGFVFEEFPKTLEIKMGDKLSFDLNYPFKVRKDESIKAFSEFEYELDVNAKETIEVVSKLYERVKLEPKFVPLKFMLDIQDNYSVVVDAFYAEGYVVYVVEHFTSEIMDTKFFMLFAVQAEIIEGGVDEN